MLQLSSNFSIPAIDYAGQGNAILGIRDGGKTYTAMKAAEELLEAGIPIIAYDPVGVWQNLKVGIGSHKGYPIVVAGGKGSDILLTATNAVEIVRAAMEENISLVIDLYSPDLINKSTWIKIVQETVDLLMYKNNDHGMRHIFLEEAAEFIPQRLQPQHSKVYASLERIARMGRNARLGLTIINQRAEEVNKAILEICAFSLIHKQVGKNSLKSIQQWLDIRQLEKVEDIIKSLPVLKQGECWAIGQSDQPKKIQVSARNTYHPNPKTKDVVVVRKTADVSGFVEKMNKVLYKEPVVVKEKREIGSPQNLNAIRELKNVIAEKEKHILLLKQENLKLSSLLKKMSNLLNDLPNYSEISIPQIKINKPIDTIPVSSKEEISGSRKLGKCPLAILHFLAAYPKEFSKVQVGVAVGYSPGSGGFNNSLAELNTLGLINRVNGKLELNRNSNYKEYAGDIPKQEYSAHTFKNKLGKCEREIYEVLLDNPETEFTKEDLAAHTPSNYSHSSGGFNNSLSTLSTLELIERNRGTIKLNPDLIELL